MAMDSFLPPLLLNDDDEPSSSRIERWLHSHVGAGPSSSPSLVYAKSNIKEEMDDDVEEEKFDIGILLSNCNGFGF